MFVHFLRMVLLDTNVLYRIAGLEKTRDIDISSVVLFINHHTCSCAKHSFFELLTNSHFSFDEKMQLLKYMKDHKIGVSTDPEIMKDLNPMFQQMVKDEAYYNRLKKIYGKHLYPELINNIHFFVICYPYICLTVYLDKVIKGDPKGRAYFRDKSIRIQKEIDRHVKRIIKNHIMATLESDMSLAKSIKETVTTVIANIMSYYYQLLSFAKGLIDNKRNDFYYRIIQKFRSIKKEILKDSLRNNIEYDHEVLSILKVMLDARLKEVPGKAGERAIFKDSLFQMARDSIYFLNEDMHNSFEEYWLQRKLESLLLDCGKIDKNDFMDYGIMQEAYYCKSVRYLLTFDDKIIKIMSAVSNSEMFQNSVQTINSFKKKTV